MNKKKKKNSVQREKEVFKSTARNVLDALKVFEKVFVTRKSYLNAFTRRILYNTAGFLTQQKRVPRPSHQVPVFAHHPDVFDFVTVLRFEYHAASRRLQAVVGVVVQRFH